MQYVPRVGELVIGTVQRSTADAYFVTLTDYTSPALLPHLSFESATKKTRPILAPGALVYARITLAHRHMDPEIECVSSSTGKADGLGPLNGGMIYNVSQGMARRLLMPKGSGLVVLEELGSAGLQFETATGRNGKFWVDSTSVQTIIAVGRAVQETDEKRLDSDSQKKAVKKIIKDLS